MMAEGGVRGILFVTLFVYLVNKRIVLQIERVYVMVGTGLKKAGRQGEIR